MNPNLALLLAIGCLILFSAALVAIALRSRHSSGGGGSARSHIKNLVNTQRSVSDTSRGGRAAPKKEEGEVKIEVRTVTGSQLSLVKKMRYAGWSLPPILYYVFSVIISILALIFFINIKFNILLQGLSLLAGPLMMKTLLERSIQKRFKAFDKDFAAFLLSLCGLIKTGLNYLQALEAAAQGLEPGSQVRYEVLLMLERLRYGIPEEKSIGAFGENVKHEEIELFVQALLLSKRVGGTLSDTLNRLSTQSRKRQYFRLSAKGAIGQQKGSLYVIVGIMVGIVVFLCSSMPDFKKVLIFDPIGWQLTQGAFLLIFIGFYWISQIVKIRV